ncbi:MAG: hypothetical protein FJX75_13320 [Armatimonadetes bacterium]|nr:hypothetical protein [Armatimonadota bacterium]
MARPTPRPTAKRPTQRRCAFCGGSGRDPFGLLSPLARCQVCGGTGRRAVPGPVGRCAFCRGSGVHPGSRLVCTACGGVGVVRVPPGATLCPRCGGTGRAAAGPPLPCSTCAGTGRVPERIGNGRQ